MKKSGASRMNGLSGEKLQDRVFGAIKSKEVTFGKSKINLYLSFQIDFYSHAKKQEETFDCLFRI
jgi:hypothetical protein